MTDDIRSEIRAEFEREQSAFPPPSDLRPRFVAAAAAQPRLRLNLQLVAAVAALLIAALVIGALVSSRIGLRGSTPAATPGATKDYGPPPVGVPLIYVDSPTNFQAWMTGFDWNGQPRATVKFKPGSFNSQATMAPDGESFITGINAKGGMWQFFDRLAQPVGEVSLPNAYSAVWSDDSSRICAMTFNDQSLTYTLWTVAPGENPVKVGDVAKDPNIGQTSVSVVACSVRNDRAILVRTRVSWPSEIWVIGLSDARVLSHHTYADAKLAGVVASADATYIAENPFGVGQLGAGKNQGSAVIRRVSDWQVVANLGLTAVRAFSGDGTRVLTTNYLLLEAAGGAAIVDWSTAGASAPVVASGARSGPRGTVIWSQDTLSLDRFTAEPAGRGFAVAFMDTTKHLSPPDTVIVVRGDGTGVELPGRYTPAF